MGASHFPLAGGAWRQPFGLLGLDPALAFYAGSVESSFDRSSQLQLIRRTHHSCQNTIQPLCRFVARRSAASNFQNESAAATPFLAKAAAHRYSSPTMPADSPASHKTPKLRRRWRQILAVLVIALFIVGGWLAWRENDFRHAQEEARDLRWNWRYADPLDAIRKDWKTAFVSDTWKARRSLRLRMADLRKHERLVERLAPDELQLVIREDYAGLSPAHPFGSVRKLEIQDVVACTDRGGGLASLDGIRAMPSLRELIIDGATLPSLQLLKGHPGLQSLSLMFVNIGCDLRGVSDLPALRTLHINFCLELTSLDGLSGLPALEKVTLSFPYPYPKIANMDALAALPALKEISLRYNEFRSLCGSAGVQFEPSSVSELPESFATAVQKLTATRPDIAVRFVQ
jgi:hypothetical protein